MAVSTDEARGVVAACLRLGYLPPAKTTVATIQTLGLPAGTLLIFIPALTGDSWRPLPSTIQA